MVNKMLESKIVFLRLVYKYQEFKNQGLPHTETLKYLKFINESLWGNNMFTGFDLKPCDKPRDSDMLSNVLTESYQCGLITNNPYRLTNIGKKEVSELKRDYLPELDNHIVRALKNEII